MRTTRALLLIVAAAIGACSANGDEAPGKTEGPLATTSAGGERGGRRDVLDRSELRAERDAMVDLLERGGIEDAEVLRAMRSVPRHELVPPELRDMAYQDRALPIAYGQTISQPSVVALMTELADVERGENVLEIGTGSGYQAAVLAELGADVHTIEIVEPLGRQAERNLRRLGYDDVDVRIGDGYAGLPSAAPFDAIVVTAAPTVVPQPLLDQLAIGGKLVAPIGDGTQDLMVITRTPGGFERERSVPVLFVPMTGEAQRARGR